MTADAPLELFLVAPPGLEAPLASEAAALGFSTPTLGRGGVTVRGDLSDMRRAHLRLRTATRVLMRIATFPAGHLSQLDKSARRVDWAAALRPDVPVRVEASCARSRIYHSGAAAERVARAIHETLGAPVLEGGDDDDTAADAAIRVLARLERDLCTLSLDCSGAPLHKRGFKPEVGKAPLRETMAAALLAACGYDGREPVLDPMCGSGSFVIEAAEIAAGLAPGRARAFAFERLAGHDAAAWAAEKAAAARAVPRSDARAHGSDRDAGAIEAARANAARAGVADRTVFERLSVSDLEPPDGPPGLVIVNPPYGARLGARGPLAALHTTLGRVLIERFVGWRLGLVTAEPGLARATGLAFAPPGPAIAHGGLSVRLYRSGPIR